MINAIEFIEKYVLADGKRIKLKNYQKKFIKQLEKIKGGRLHLV